VRSSSGRAWPAVSEVDVVEVEFPDRFGAGSVDGGEDEGEPGGGGGRRGHRLGDVGRSQWEDHGVLVAADADPRGRVGEDDAGFLAVPEQ